MSGIAIDIGGTTIKAMSVDTAGTIVERLTAPTPVGGDAVLSAVVEVAESLRDRLRRRGHGLARIGIATPGVVDPASGVVGFASNLGWRDMPLRDRVAARLGVEVRVENDARAGALAEHAVARPGDAAGLAYVPIGTGVAAAYCVDGLFLRGGANMAGEFGHIRVVPGGDPCGCGASGCVEAYASAAGIRSRYAQRTGTSVETPDIVAAVAADPVARDVWDDAVDALAAGLAALVSLLDPARIVVGGGLSRAGDALLAPLRARLATHLAWRAIPQVDASALGPHSNLVGAALLGSAVDARLHPLVQHLAGQLGVGERTTLEGER